jgi:hypothetical protein
MLFRRGPLRGLLLSVLALVAGPALSQNLLVNSGFDRDLGGWLTSTAISNPAPPPDLAQASASWSAIDASGSVTSGGLALHAMAFTGSTATAAATQCVAVTPGSVATVGAKILTPRQFTTASTSVAVSFFPSADCSGTLLARASTNSLPFVVPETSSGGVWLPTTTQALASAGSRSALAEVSVRATGTFAYGQSEVTAVADDAFLTLTPAATTTWILPSAAWVHGAAGSYWMTQFTLSNPGTTDAAVTLKWLGHDADGRGGHEFTYVVRAGQTLVPDEETWQINHPEDWGAILVTSSSPALFVQSETRTYVPGGGTVGQGLPALGPADFASSTPKSFAPIRENASFRTNLVLANATEAPLTARVVLYAADGTQLGSRNVDLPPLGMTQLNRVATLLGAATLDLGRIAISTSTPGGLVAAYASIIDNRTNDPRTILPQDVPAASSGPNLLANPGFDRDLTGWNLTLSDVAPNAGRYGGWTSSDANGSSASGSALLSASSAGFGGYGWVTLTQCVPVAASRVYGLRAKVRGDASGLFGNVPSPGLSASFRPGADCTGNEIERKVAALFPFNRTLSGTSTGGEWYTLAASAETAPELARSALVTLGVGASGSIHGAGISAFFDDASFFEGDSSWAWIVPAAASVNGSGGSRWTTDLIISNAGELPASVYVDLAPKGLGSWVVNVSGGKTLSLPNILASILGHDQTWGPLRITATSPGIAVTAETSSPTAGSGTVGQALAALAPRDLIGSVAKSIAPIRDDAASRTNLVVSNATESPLTAHVDLFDAAGILIGSRDIPLEPLTAAQISGVGWALAGTSVNPGRIAISTPTPGGLVAAYASVIDNTTNDPRTILPR